MKLKGAIFDLDGTLVNSLILWNDVIWPHIGLTYGKGAAFRPTEADDRAVRTMIAPEAMALIHRNYGLGETPEALAQVFGNILVDFYQNKVELKTGVRAFLDYLKREGVKMCVASASPPAFIHAAVEHLSLGNYFEGILSCETLGKGKDKPDIYYAACELLGTPIEATAVFEDSYVALETARAAGFGTVGLYDACNYDQERLAAASDIYISAKESMSDLIGRV